MICNADIVAEYDETYKMLEITTPRQDIDGEAGCSMIVVCIKETWSIYEEFSGLLYHISKNRQLPAGE